MPDYDPLTISDADLKALTPAERAQVYKARAAAKREGWVPSATPAASAATPGAAATPAATPAAATPAAAAAADGHGAAAPAASSPGASSPGAGGPGAAGAGTTAGAAGAAATGAGAAATAAPAAAAPRPAAAAARAAAPAAPPAPKEPPFVLRILESIDGSTWQWRHGYAEIKIPRERLLDAAWSLKAAGFDYLSFITEVDWQDRLELIYHMFAYDYRTQPLGVILRAELPRQGVPEIASVTPVWPGAEFMEREAFEMMGIRFLGHPDLRRILLPDDFVGFPMRRDYETDFDYITVKQLVHESD
jgi:NADH-quinone oxidoreductase subunit C